LKNKSSAYSAEELIKLDSAFYLIFNGAAKSAPVEDEENKKKD